MAVVDRWKKRDGSPTRRAGVGLRWKVVVPGMPSRSFESKRAAEVFERELWQASRVPVDYTTVDDLVELYLQGKADLTLDAVNALRSARSHVLNGFSGVAARDIRRHEVQAWVAGLKSQHGKRGDDGKRQLRPASWEVKRRALRVFKAVLQIAVDAGTIDTNPAKGVTIPRGDKKEVKALTVEQLKKLAAECRGYESMVMLLGSTGLRLGECVALDVADIRVDVRRLRVRRSKTGKGRDVPIPAKVLETLPLDDDGPLFRSPNGMRINGDNWRARVFTPAVRRLGWEGVTPHVLRHTAASLMIASGASVKDIQAALGHATAQMTLDLYGHLFDGSLDDVARRMDRFL